MPEDWLTTQDAADLSGYHTDYVRKLVKAGKIKGRKFGPVWQVGRQSLLDYMKRMQAIGERRGPKPISQP